MKPWTAFIYGVVAALFYSILARVIPAARVDDPVEVVPVYFVYINIYYKGSGFIGIVLSSFFDTKAGLFYGFGASLLGK
jgi:Amt family ammonium transporter